MQYIKSAVTILALISACLSVVSAQDKKKKDKPVPVPVEVRVNLDVKDAAGNRVTDLAEGQVKIFEDGVEQKATYFRKKGPKLNIGLMLDNSASLNSQLKSLALAGHTFLDSTPADSETFVIRFISSNKIETLQEWTANKKELNEAVDQMFAELGRSALFDAIYLSAGKLMEREKNDPSQTYALVVLSDMEDRDSYYSLKNIMDRLKGSGIQIFAVSFLPDPSRQVKPSPERYLTNELVRETGGNVIFLEKDYADEHLKSAAKAISDALSFP